MTLLAAATALGALAAGLEPKRGEVTSGALALQTSMKRGQLDRDLQDAALGLEAVATGRPLSLDQVRHAHVGTLAVKVCELAAKS